MKYSMLKTFAGKYNTTKSKILKRYRVGKDFGVTYTNSKARKSRVYFTIRVSKERRTFHMKIVTTWYQWHYSIPLPVWLTGCGQTNARYAVQKRRTSRFIISKRSKT